MDKPTFSTVMSYENIKFFVKSYFTLDIGYKSVKHDPLQHSRIHAE
jgi:hypothetical protein